MAQTGAVTKTPLFNVVAGTVVAWLALGVLIKATGDQTWQVSFDTAFVWARNLLGLATTVAGLAAVGGKTVVTSSALPDWPLLGGLACVLGGVTIMDVGSWWAPAGLAFVAATHVAMRGFAAKNGLQ